MIFSSDRLELRKLYFDSWHKYLTKQPLTDLETQITRIIEHHPEYHHYLSNLDNLDKDFPPEIGETNPFLHMGLHMGLIEQVVTNRPYGIHQIYQQLCQQQHDEHKVQHMMMDHLAESIWSAQKHHVPPDESNYLAQLQLLISG
ncbi:MULTISPECIES: DUF1841 family protein [Cysteiniphilum]|uniref:DUF1841 family protein n=1 Tax=Cysteiniphilum TaxID=2056696 RepID=UPI00177D17D9|nr:MULTISPECIES: DUF1841 family protein [Cysteiniphilum]